MTWLIINKSVRVDKLPLNDHFVCRRTIHVCIGRYPVRSLLSLYLLLPIKSCVLPWRDSFFFSFAREISCAASHGRHTRSIESHPCRREFRLQLFLNLRHVSKQQQMSVLRDWLCCICCLMMHDAAGRVLKNICAKHLNLV